MISLKQIWRNLIDPPRLLTGRDLHKLIDDGVITTKHENVNGASIDVTLDDVLMFESAFGNKVVDLMAKESIQTDYTNMTVVGSMGLNYKIESYILQPGQFILASTIEYFNLPKNITCEFVLKSSLARNGLEHLNAGYCDPGWHNSKLTLELKNMCQYHHLVLKTGMKIGQVKFYKHYPVPDDMCYSKKGQYNNQKEVTASKGVR